MMRKGAVEKELIKQLNGYTPINYDVLNGFQKLKVKL